MLGRARRLSMELGGCNGASGGAIEPSGELLDARRLLEKVGGVRELFDGVFSCYRVAREVQEKLEKIGWLGISSGEDQRRSGEAWRRLGFRGSRAVKKRLDLPLESHQRH